MPETWLREMRKVESLTPHEDLLARAERGPSLPPHPQPPRRRLAAAAVAFAVFFAAAFLLWSGFRGQREVTTVPRGSGTVSPGVDVPSDAIYPPPFFPASDGWYRHHSSAEQAGNGMVAWASTTPFEKGDLFPLAPAIPEETLSTMPPGTIVLVAEVVAHHLAEEPWPPGSESPLHLADATIRGPEAEEPRVPMTVYDLDNGYVLIRAYFAGTSVTDTEVARAQAELDTLQVPPACPEPASPADAGWYAFGLSATQGAPGTAVSVAGFLGFTREDGSYVHESPVIELWWDADVNSWTSLLGDHPGASLLATSQQTGCSVSMTFSVPVDAASGSHGIVALETNAARSSATAYGSAVFTVAP